MKKSVEGIVDNLQLVALSKGFRIEDFNCAVELYSDFLKNNAMIYQESEISKTHLLINKKNADIVGYLTLINDCIKLSDEEKKEHDFEEIPFATFPTLKIAKLAVDKNYNDKYKGIGSLLIELAIGFADNINNIGIGCKFITIDADIENNPEVDKFYYKCGFKYNENYKKRTRTISMRLELFD